MFTLALRGSLALSAALLMLAAWLNPFGPPEVVGALPFSKVMEELRGATTLHLQLQKSGQTSEILVRAPGLVRKQETPQRYQVAAGSRLWKIDEAENTVVEGDSPWFLSADRQIDLLGLLEVGVKDASPLLVARPYDRATYDGRECYAYHVDLPTERGKVHIDAFADVANNQLVGIVARGAEASGANQLPLAELRLLALNPAVEDDKFKVAKSLTEDGRIGKVSDAQGIVVLRAMLARRWTPVCRETLLRPGDWLRTELRGANAVKATLSSEVELTLGPGTQIECVSPGQARLHNGQVQVKAGTEFTLLAPRDGKRIFKAGDKQLVRVDRDEKIVDVGQTPVWLAGFEGTSNNESLGSLIVEVDGRNEPLSVGYHKVSVEIRDQIARTTIEESFVNHTGGRLEGVFHFPLPQDASISGFGMWIGNDLVEADVVEKQRAREIFETILREKRDPGLLEWMGGNIFKARVFPIEPHSEKRIKIVYTQVLPLRGNRYRYSYGLRSEMLRTKPLRELSLNVTVNSALPLKSVTCPTHTARTLQTGHSAQIEFAAQEYTPTRDFEVMCEVDGKGSDVVVVPHRRGSDGYFLVQLTPPGPEGNWQRELLADGKPLKIVLLCDTSSSMDSEKRRQQSEFVGSVLSALGDDDRVQLACADVGTAWAFPEPVVVNADNIAKARALLDERVSLGWTNLDRAFADIMQKAPADAHVIYIGDGIVSAGTTDPAAFVDRLRQLVKGDTKGAKRTIHSITVGNSHETVVMKGIASVGGGSTRTIHGEQTPQSVALELLNEIAQPGLRDLNVEFRGVKVAAVYPEKLPNVAAGTQQILVGRYLPEGKDQVGEVIVTGMRGEEKVRYAARINLKDAEDGNSFIPRLWARGHLDQLLAQGQSTTIREEIIGLSEEFHIITPYTSLLVLETDADRERFGVKRRYEMRDGEQFFAQGKANANFELLQAQMRRAGDWRAGLRRRVLGQLRGLGRDAKAFQQMVHGSPYLGDETFAVNGMLGRWSGNAPMGGPMSGGWGGISGGYGFGGGGGMPADGGMFFDSLSDGMESLDRATTSLGAITEGLKKSESDVEELSISAAAEPAAAFEKELSAKDSRDFDLDLSSDFNGLAGEWSDLRAKRKIARLEVADKALFDYPMGRRGGKGFAYQSYFQRHQSPDYMSWMNTLFPALVPRPTKPAELPPVDPWSPEALELSKSLLRTESLRKFDGGIELRRISDQFDPRWIRQASRHRDLVLYSATGWLTRTLNLGDQTIVNYCTPQERGVYSLAFLLGRVRPTVDAELEQQPLGLNDGSLSPFHEQYRGWIARIEPAGDNRVKLILTLKDSSQVHHFMIDTARHVLVKHEWFNDGKLNGTETWDDFIEAAGSWWARKSIRLDEKNRKTSETTLELKALTRPEYTQQMDVETATKASVQFIHLPFVTVNVARQKSADGTANFDDRLAMILHLTQRQQWDEMWKHVDAIEKLPGKPGLSWIRTILQVTIRRNEEARARLLQNAKDLVAKRQQDELFLADFVLGQAHGVTAWPEFLEFVTLIKPLYERQPADLDAMLRWTDRRAQCHEGMGEQEQMLTLRRQLAESSPWHIHWQTEYTRRLAAAGQFDAAHAWLRKEIDRPIERPDYEDETLRSAVTDLYRTQGRWADLLKFTTEWVARNPESTSYNSAYAQHLVALVYNDQFDKANALIQQWFDESRVDGKMSAAQRARLESALNFSFGSSYNLYFQRMEERWFQPLADLARFFVKHPHHADIASRIVNYYQFQQNDAADRLRGEFFAMLQSDVAKLTPGQIGMLVGWTLGGRMELTAPINGRKQLDASEIPNDVWKQIATSLKPRWEQAQDKHDKHALAEALRSIYSNRFRELLLPFLRERIVGAHQDYKLGYISTLFDQLLATEWTAEIEQEAFARLRDLSDAKEPADRLATQVPALYRLVDAMLANRQVAMERVLSDKGGQDQLTRKQLAEKKDEIRKTVRQELSARLAAEAKKEDGPLSAWFGIEQTWIDVQRGESLPLVNQICWQILGDAPPKPEADEEDDDPVVVFVEQTPHVADPSLTRKTFESLLKNRAMVTVMNLAARRSAKPDDVTRVLKFIDAGIEQGRLADQAANKNQPGEAAQVAQGSHGAPWRNTKFRMLVALDRPDDLDRELRQWIRDDVSTAPWRQSLARLVAERGKLDEAIQLFEACEKDKLLTSGDYKLLADWYLVVDRRTAYERSRIEVYKAMPEGTLNQLAYQIGNRWARNDTPLTEVDDNTLFLFKALFEKSGQPEQYLWHLRNVYAATRDFRMLQMLPDAVLGRSPQQIYAFLQQVHSQVLYELRNEAAADPILERIKTLREGERTVTDLRALDLMEALVERKSSDLQNQAGPHIVACVAALQRAFTRKFGDGEPVMMSTLLFSWGSLPPKLAEEQIREVKELQKLVPEQSRAHLSITNDYCNLLGSYYGRRDEAIREMSSEVRAYTQANNGNWPHQDNHILGSFVSHYEQSGQYATGEGVLQQFLARPEHLEQRKWLDDRLMAVYNQALEHDGAVSLGSGRAKLFLPLYRLCVKQLEQSADETERYNIVSRLMTTFDIAHRHKIAGGSETIQTFAFEVLPVQLKRQVSYYRATVPTPIRLLADMAGARASLRYIVERIEQYPQRLEITWESAWHTLGYELAQRREAAGETDLDERVLAMSIRELKRELRTGENRNGYIYHRGYQYFWAAKAEDFAKAAEEVLAERKNSGRRLMAVANYLWGGLPKQQRAIEILFVAHQQGILDEGGQMQLVRWLHETNRYAESIPLLEALAALRTTNMEYRTHLMRAYFRSQRPQQLADLIQKTSDDFHKEGLWTEGHAAAFGTACWECGKSEAVVQYLKEAIALHQRANPGSVNDGTLSSYYATQANAYAALGKTKEAVEAASAAIVCWSANHHDRGQQLITLNNVLNASKDLDGYVKVLDAQVAETQQESPIIRKGIGKTYLARGENQKAIDQLKLAVEMQPHDAEIYTDLIRCYDAINQPTEGTRQLLKLIDLKHHDLALYQQLADRLKGNEVEAERAATSIIEASPNEAENHAALAELRQRQDRWSEAIPHWEQVAELRKLEPNGLLKLAEAQLHEKQWDAVRTTINKVRKTEWASRFNDVQNQATQIENRIPKQ